MNQEHKDLLIAAAKACGWEVEEYIDERHGLSIHNGNTSNNLWNPIISKADRYDLARRCKLTIDFGSGVVGLPIIKRSEDSIDAALFTPQR